MASSALHGRIWHDIWPCRYGRSVVFRWNKNFKFAWCYPIGCRIPFSFYANLHKTKFDRAINLRWGLFKHKRPEKPICDDKGDITKVQYIIGAITNKYHTRPFARPAYWMKNKMNRISGFIYLYSVQVGIVLESSLIKHKSKIKGILQNVITLGTGVNLYRYFCDFFC